MRLLKSLLIMTLLTASVWADGGSLYTRKGIGDMFFALNARRAGLGGGGIALNSLTDLSNLNPAGWFSIKSTRFEIGLYYNSMSLQNSSSNIRYAETNLSGFTLAMPIDTAKGIVLAAGMAPYSNVMYEVSEAKTDPLVGDYKATYEGSGGLNKIFFGLTTKLPLNFTLGASFEYFYGKIEYNSTTTMSNTEYKNGVFKNLNNFQGSGANVGIISPDLSGLFNSKDITDFHFGIAIDYIFNMKRDSSEVSGNTDSTFTSFSTNQKVKIPTRISAGAALKLFNRYQVIADYFYQPFGDLAFNDVKVNSFQSLNRYSLGVEYANPHPDRESYWDNVALRLGFSYETSQYYMNSTSIVQYAIHTGCSLPLSKGSTIDLALIVGTRGTTDNGLIKENFINFNIGLNLGELWFQRVDR